MSSAAQLAHQGFAPIQDASKSRGQLFEDSLSSKADCETEKTSSKPICASKIFPRRKNGQQRRELSKPVVLTEEVLRQYFNTPLRAAAKELGICATALKKVCRSLGIQKWPYRSLYAPKPSPDPHPSPPSSPRPASAPGSAAGSQESAGAVLLCQLQRSLSGGTSESAGSVWSGSESPDENKANAPSSDNSISRLLN